jgi:hypothetical protein
MFLTRKNHHTFQAESGESYGLYELKRTGYTSPNASNYGEAQAAGTRFDYCQNYGITITDNGAQIEKWDQFQAKVAEDRKAGRGVLIGFEDGAE